MKRCTTASILAIGLLSLLASGCGSQQPAVPAPAERPGQGALDPLTKPVVSPATQPAYSLANFSEQRLPAVPAFAFVARQTTVRAIQTAIDGAMTDLFKDPNLGQNIIGPSTFVYTGMSAALDEVFTLEIGFPVAPNYIPANGVQVRPLQSMRCVSVDFQGSLAAIDKAYDKVLPLIAERKLKRTGETREIYFNWQGPASPDNQVRIAVGVE